MLCQLSQPVLERRLHCNRAIFGAMLVLFGPRTLAVSKKGMTALQKWTAMMFSAMFVLMKRGLLSWHRHEKGG